MHVADASVGHGRSLNGLGIELMWFMLQRSQSPEQSTYRRFRSDVSGSVQTARTDHHSFQWVLLKQKRKVTWQQSWTSFCFWLKHLVVRDCDCHTYICQCYDVITLLSGEVHVVIPLNSLVCDSNCHDSISGLHWDKLSLHLLISWLLDEWVPPCNTVFCRICVLLTSADTKPYWELNAYFPPCVSDT